MFSSNLRLPLLGAVIGGLVAGILDIIYAFILSGLAGRKPLGALKAVASGVLGAEAFKGGMPTVALGLVLHLGITIAAAFVYLFCPTRRTSATTICFADRFSAPSSTW
jgi:hypothetical protein